MRKHTNRILVVTDDETLSCCMRSLLEAEQFEVNEARSGQEAMTLIDEKKFCMVISDFALSTMSGTQLLNEIRALSCNLPFILLSERRQDFDPAYFDVLTSIVGKVKLLPEIILSQPALPDLKVI